MGALFSTSAVYPNETLSLMSSKQYTSDWMVFSHGPIYENVVAGQVYTAELKSVPKLRCVGPRSKHLVRGQPAPTVSEFRYLSKSSDNLPVFPG